MTFKTRPIRMEVLEDRMLLNASPELVADINPGAGGSYLAVENPDHSPYLTGVPSLTEFDGTLFFGADDGSNGNELWKSDGTEAGTELVAEINPGAGGSYPDRFKNVDGTLFFTAVNGINGKELWKSDGTEAGTVRVKDIRPGIASSNPSELTNVNGTLFFTADNGINGKELWKSDGTEAGTVRVKDFRPGIGNLYLYGLTNVNGTLFFIANRPTNPLAFERVLWKSDGTEAGTVRVKDFSDQQDFSGRISNLTAVNGTLFFSAHDEFLRRELWKSDGTEAGTVRVKDIGLTGYYHLVDVNGTLFFNASHTGNHFRNTRGDGWLWKSDGTEAGTVTVKDIRGAYLIGEFNGNLFFTAMNGDLWKSDGTEAGTVRVKDGIGDGGTHLGEVNGNFFFYNYNYNRGIRQWDLHLWRSDGTEAGTVMVANLGPQLTISNSRSLYSTTINETLFFRDDDGTNGYELWKLDPVLFGTSGDDTISVHVNPGAVAHRYEVTINGGQTYLYPDGELHIVGGGGTDTVVVQGTAADQTLVASPDSFELTDAEFSLTAEGIEHLTVRGNGGNDVATLTDSAGNERVVAKVNNTFVRDLAGTFTHRAIGFAEVTLISSEAQAGNFDMANLFDSVADDVFIGDANSASIASPGYRVNTVGYDRNIARSNQSGQDVAILNGTAQGDENFTARVTGNPANNFGMLRSGPGAPLPFLNRAIGFTSVTANSNGGNDRSYLFDGSGNDILFASATSARLTGTRFEFTANDFQRVNSNANAGGNDQAILVDGANDDRLVGTGNRATLFGDSNSFIQATAGFERVTGDASEGGTDRLSLANDITFAFLELGSWEL